MSRHQGGTSSAGLDLNNTGQLGYNNDGDFSDSDFSISNSNHEDKQQLPWREDNQAGAPQPNARHTIHAPQPQRSKHHQKHHAVGTTGRLHTRVPSSKALHRHHGSSSKLNKPNKRPQSPPPLAGPSNPGEELSLAHRRAHSDVKLSNESSTTILKRNRSHHDVARRNKSFDKIKAAAATAAPRPRPTTSRSQKNLRVQKGQVHFELGIDGQGDDWVDASLSPSPHRGAPAEEPAMPAPRLETTQQKEYLTSRILARTPSCGAPPKMSSETVSVVPSQASPHSTSRDSSTASGTPPTGNVTAASSRNRDELTSRFITGPSSGLPSEGSFYNSGRPVSRSPDDDDDDDDEQPRRRSFASLGNRSNRSFQGDTDDDDDDDDGDGRAVLRRPAPPPADKSRTQQKLNLQRASSVMEPGQAVGPAARVADPLVDVSGPGYDGGGSRDPRVGKLLERTGMEYLVVRRYQNPVSRSLGRLKHVAGSDKNKRIPGSGGGGPVANGSRAPSMRPGGPPLHLRNNSMPGPRNRDENARRPATPQRSHSIKTSGAGFSFETEDGTPKMGDGVGRFVLGHDDDDSGGGTAAALRNLWEKSLDLSASQD